MMARITREFHFEMGHTLQHHPGKCKRLHGHSYKLEISVEGSVNDQGMVMDFGDLKTLARASVDKLDHMFMICMEDPRAIVLQQMDPDSLVIVPYPPTAENIAHKIRSEIANHLPNQVVHVALWETDDSRAEA